MVAVVVDNSVLMTLVLAEENWNQAEDLLARNAGNIICPEFCLYEYGNGIRTAVSRERISKERAMEALAGFDDLGLEVRTALTARTLPSVGSLAIRRNLSLYDAAYVWLAVEQSASIASYDKALIAAARAELVPIFEWERP